MNGLLLLASDSATTHAEVPTWVTVLFGVILASMIAALALEEKIHAKKSIIVGTFAVMFGVAWLTSHFVAPIRFSH